MSTQKTLWRKSSSRHKQILGQFFCGGYAIQPWSDQTTWCSLQVWASPRALCVSEFRRVKSIWSGQETKCVSFLIFGQIWCFLPSKQGASSSVFQWCNLVWFHYYYFFFPVEKLNQNVPMAEWYNNFNIVGLSVCHTEPLVSCSLIPASQIKTHVPKQTLLNYVFLFHIDLCKNLSPKAL